jgi:hypothetical protein
MAAKKKALMLSQNEADLLYYLLDKIGEYFAKDDRPDHGLAQLKEIRESAREIGKDDNHLIIQAYILAGKANRFRRRF